ncbi:MAG: c-type cytochrome [Imperialibacter sp.]
MNQPSFHPKQIISLLNLLIVAVLLLLVASGGLIASLMIKPGKLAAVAGTATTPNKTIQPASPRASTLWEAPLESSLPAGSQGEMIRYGKELIAHTSLYLGPKGTVAQISNGLNCQNCHLQAGTKPFGNNYGGVASTYPQVRPRSGRETSIASRVNGCFERSLNGRPLKEDSKEMQAIVAYINWLGQDVEKGKKPEGAGLVILAYLDEPANPAAGKLLYEQKCVVCHMQNGAGLANGDGTEYVYPPLWGDHSYNQGAGLYRLSKFAGYIKANMPLGVTYDNPQLSDEEAWHIAAYVNSLPRPGKDLSKDWPDISKKPIDHPFGPYADGFEEEQHKYGPFKPIEEKRRAQAVSN